MNVLAVGYSVATRLECTLDFCIRRPYKGGFYMVILRSWNSLYRIWRTMNIPLILKGLAGGGQSLLKGTASPVLCTLLSPSSGDRAADGSSSHWEWGGIPPLA